MSSHGGSRSGAGRPKGSLNKATEQQKRRLNELARENTDSALKTLVDIAEHGQSESARIAAANSILDRAYGRPGLAQPVDTETDVSEIQSDEREKVWSLVSPAARREFREASEAVLQSDQ